MDVDQTALLCHWAREKSWLDFDVLFTSTSRLQEVLEF